MGGNFNTFGQRARSTQRWTRQMSPIHLKKEYDTKTNQFRKQYESKSLLNYTDTKIEREKVLPFKRQQLIEILKSSRVSFINNPYGLDMRDMKSQP